MSQSLEATESETTMTSLAAGSGRWPTEDRAGDGHRAGEGHRPGEGQGSDHSPSTKSPTTEPSATRDPAAPEAIAGANSERVFFREGELGTYTGGPLEFHDVEGLGPESSRPSRILYAYGARRRQAGVGALAILGTAVVFFLGSLLVTRVIDLTRGPHISADLQEHGAKSATTDKAGESTEGATQVAAAGQPQRPDVAGGAAAKDDAAPVAPGSNPSALVPQPPVAQAQVPPDAAGASSATNPAAGAAIAVPAPVALESAPKAVAPAAPSPAAPPLAEAALPTKPAAAPKPSARAARPRPVAVAPKPAAVAPAARPLPAAGLGGTSTAAKKPPTASF